MISNVLEVARFAQMLLGRGSWNGRTILRPQSVDELCRPQVRKYTPENDFYGLTTESAKRIGPGWIGHNGYSPPYRSRFIVNIEHGAAVSILFSDGEDFSIQGRALEKHIGRRLVPVEREDAANTKESGKESFDWSQFAGRFVGRDGTAAFIELSGDGAALRYDGDDYSLQVVGDDIFLCTEIGGRKRQILGLPPIAGHLGRYITINSSPFRQQGYFEEKWQSLVARVEQFQARFKS